MKTATSILALALLTGGASAQSITLPGKVTVDEPGIVVVRPSAVDADDVRWYALGKGLQAIPPDVVQPKVGVFIGLAMRPGEYKLGCVCAKAVNGKAVMSLPYYVTVVVGGEPVPPVPPAPVPDALTRAVQAAYSAEADPGKAALKAQLAAGYAAGASLAADPSVNTLGDLFKAMSARMPPPGALPLVRRAVGDELNAQLGTVPSAPVNRPLAAQALSRASAAVSAAK